MLLNFGKCLHTEYGNKNEKYIMGNTVLGITTKEKDVGVTFSANMKVSEQCGIAAHQIYYFGNSSVSIKANVHLAVKL